MSLTKVVIRFIETSTSFLVDFTNTGNVSCAAEIRLLTQFEPHGNNNISKIRGNILNGIIPVKQAVICSSRNSNSCNPVLEWRANILRGSIFLWRIFYIPNFYWRDCTSSQRPQHIRNLAQSFDSKIPDSDNLLVLSYTKNEYSLINTLWAKLKRARAFIWNLRGRQRTHDKDKLFH